MGAKIVDKTPPIPMDWPRFLALNVKISFAMILVMVPFGLLFGKNFTQAVSDGAAFSIAGSIASICFFLVNQGEGRSGYVGFFPALFLITGSNDTNRPFLASLIMGLTIAVPTALIIGFFVRRCVADKPSKQLSNPMSDAELDSMTASIR